MFMCVYYNNCGLYSIFHLMFLTETYKYQCFFIDMIFELFYCSLKKNLFCKQKLPYQFPLDTLTIHYVLQNEQRYI